MTDNDRPWPYASDDAEGAAPPPQPSGPPKRGIRWGLIVAVILGAALVALAIQNTDSVPVEWLFFDVDTPLVLLLLITAVAAVLLSEALGYIWRRRRRRRAEEKAELERLRAQEQQRSDE